MNTTMQWADLWTNDLKRWEQREYLRKERGMMMESECTKMLLSTTKSTAILDLFTCIF